MSQREVYLQKKVAIIGGGCAGYSAAIYSARAGLSTSVFEGLARGGQLATTSDVDNYPGFANTVQGPWLTEQMRAQAERCGAVMMHDVVTSLKKRVGGGFDILTDGSGYFSFDAVVLATGAEAKWLGIPSEEKYKHKGVSACATCDGFFFRNKDVVVVGGGNVAVSESIFLANLAHSVTLVHRRDALRAEKLLQETMLKNNKIRVLWNRVVSEITGDDERVTGVDLRSTVGDSDMRIPCDGVFVAIGHVPNTSLVKGFADLDSNGYVITEPKSTRTSVPGLFAAGDVQDPIYRQAVTSAGTGCMAALDAERYLASIN